MDITAREAMSIIAKAAIAQLRHCHTQEDRDKVAYYAEETSHAQSDDGSARYMIVDNNLCLNDAKCIIVANVDSL